MEKLTEEVLINIFSKLNLKDIENVANSSERFRNIITTTKLLMRKLSLLIDFDDVKGKPWKQLPYNFFLLKHINIKNNSKVYEFIKDMKKNLTLDGGNFDDEIANFVYFEMNLDKIVDYREKHGQIMELKKTSVKNLAIKSENDNFEYFEKLFQCSEELEVLSVDLPDKKRLEFFHLMTNLPKLKYLKLSGFGSEEFEPKLKFNRLERLILQLILKLMNV